MLPTQPAPRACGARSVARMSDQRPDEQPAENGDSPMGGDETTEDQLDADNEVEEDMLKTLDPDAPPA